ncbi:MAG: LD-carboxypeptidase [Dysgonamonadaceae bacterium]|jgi:muramoyltetrapeptide carboxypeptidase|nr:LD-carboxypeptidase [Dysgonamonadaceae bacterium]
MNRRNFLQKATAFSAAGLLSQTIKPQILFNPTSESPIIKPNRLKKGDKIGLIAPGFQIKEEQLEKSIQNLKIFGFQAVYSPRLFEKHGYFSGTDQSRANDINELFANPEVKGIMAIKGGYGCTRILNLLDYQTIRENPKIIIGFSDVTALLNAIHQETGLITFHGPVSQTIYRDYNAMQFRRIIMNPEDTTLIESSPDDLKLSSENPEYARYTITSGRAEGQLAGGNLSVLASMTGTKYQLNGKGKLIFIEEIDEDPYRIDRMLTQLIDSGILQDANGIMFGICKGCNTSKNQITDSFSLREVIENQIKPLGIPACYGLSFGHNIHNFTLPIGVNAKLDTEKMTVKLTESAVL